MQQDQLIPVDRSGVPRTAVYTEFILWSAMPDAEQQRLGITSQKQFADQHNIAENTLSRWKHRPDFETRVDAILKVWAVGKTPNVVQGIYKAAVKGNPMSQLLWLQYFKGFTSNKDQGSQTVKVEVGPNDVRFIIEGLPEPLRSKHYANLAELIADANAVQSARTADDTSWDEPAPENVQDEADQDASHVSESQGNALAAGYKASVRANMVGEAFPHHHQSAAWRGEE